MFLVEKDGQSAPLRSCKQLTDPNMLFSFPDLTEFPWLTSFQTAVADMARASHLVTSKSLLVAVRCGRAGEGLVLLGNKQKRNAMCYGV